MRIAVRLDAKREVVPSPYAVLWLDAQSCTWIREGYLGLDLPEGGTLDFEPGAILICAPHDNNPRLALEELRMGQPCTDEMVCGVARWLGSPELPPISGHWALLQKMKIL